jgi:predicted O-linked N-acetylglucosamine transferase (SPINDLY family)/Tfp pilus assembly protein PilF
MAEVDQLLRRAADEARRGALADARRSCERALQRAPTHRGAQQLHAMLLAQLGDRPAAIRALRRLVARLPGEVEPLANLGGLLAEEGAHAEAIGFLEQAVARRPDWAALHFNLGNALSAAGSLEAALSSYDRAISLDPRLAVAHNNRAATARRLGRLSEAAAGFRATLAADPGFLMARANLGAVLAALNDDDAAIEELVAACAADRSDAESLALLGDCLLRSGGLAGRLERFRHAADATAEAGVWEAIAAAFLERGEIGPAALVYAALAERSNSPAHLGRLGLALLLRGYETGERPLMETAVDALRRALDQDPKLVPARMHLGAALKDLGRSDEALAVLDGLPIGDPAHADGVATLLELRAARWDWSDYEALRAALRGAVLEHGFAAPPMGIIVRFDEPALLQRATRQYLAAHAVVPPPRAPAPRRRSMRLRIGYLSPDFRDHPVAHAIAPVLEAHDRARVEVVGIATLPGDGTPAARRVRDAFDDIVEPPQGARDADTLERLVRGLALDVLVDLGGLTAGGSLRLLARRAAPIQVAYLGYPATTGAAGVDFVLSDRFVIPPAAVERFDERVVWLPGSFLPGEPLVLPETPQATRAEAGLPATGFVFCNFNQPVRLNPAAVETFLDVLRAVPDSVLWLRAPDAGAAARLRAFVAARGVDPSRVVFAERTSTREAHFDRLRLADLFLDTLPYNAHTTGREALAAGLPLLTQAGAAFAGRVAGSVLTSLGLDELITTGRAEFVARAAELAAAPARLAQLRAGLPARRARSPSFNPALQARQLEAAYAALVDAADDASREPLVVAVR